MKKKSHIFVIVYRILFIYRVKIVTMILFYLCIKTQRTKPSISRFTAVARLRSQSETVAQVLILSTKSAKGCRGAEWIVGPWLGKMIQIVPISGMWFFSRLSVFSGFADFIKILIKRSVQTHNWIISSFCHHILPFR